MEEPTPNKPRKIDTGLVIGLLAVVINIITVTVYIQQAKIMRQQLHASVWPHLECLPSYNESGFYLEIENTGVGPAIIKGVEMKILGRPVASLDSVFYHAIGTDSFPHYVSTVENRVIAAGQKIKPFDVKDSTYAKKLYQGLRKVGFEYHVCYESIYGEAWKVFGTEVVEGGCK